MKMSPTEHHKRIAGSGVTSIVYDIAPGGTIKNQLAKFLLKMFL